MGDAECGCCCRRMGRAGTSGRWRGPGSPWPPMTRIGADDVNPLTTSAFALPGRLSVKADPALIGGDEQHFAAMAESLEESIADLSGRLDAERKAPGGIGQEAM